VREQWELEDVEGLVHNLNDLLREVQGVKALVVLGEWEDMLQLWTLPRPVLRTVLDDGVLDGAWNVAALRSVLDG
jgi:hypothetical protein